MPAIPAAIQTFVLAGGLGTRLRQISGDHPKALMPVGGEPFLDRLLRRLAAQGLHQCILCLSYKANSIIEHYRVTPIEGISIAYSVEDEPRGTAGALRVAQVHWADQNLIVNGDTELQFDISHFCGYHSEKSAAISVGLANVPDASRFGRVSLDTDGRLVAFLEKDGKHAPGLVNAGVYIASRRALECIPGDSVYSIEKDWLPSLVTARWPIFGLTIAREFIDIGTPDDYERLANRA